MDTDIKLVACLVSRIATRLSYHCGTNDQFIHEDDVLHVTRATLVTLSKTAIAIILEPILGLLEDLAAAFTGKYSHPDHVISSELYLLHLAADCCSANWAASSRGGNNDGSLTLLDEELVSRYFDIFKRLVKPLPDDYVLPAEALLEEISRYDMKPSRTDHTPASHLVHIVPNADFLGGYANEFDVPIMRMVEFITASSWLPAFNYVKGVLYSMRTTIVADTTAESVSSPRDTENSALVILRLLSFVSVDGAKLGLLIQELCSSYLHFRKQHQNTVAVAIPFIISRWMGCNPPEFLQIHVLRKKLDGNADTLFDMTQTVIDNGRRKAALYPMQTTLLFLLPDVFEVASNLREGKSNSVMKKVIFLEGLRKSLRNGNEQAGFCLMMLLRAARHFDSESDAAFVSYAMDVQDEVRDAIFRSTISGSASPPFDQNMITAALVTLAYLNSGEYIDTLVATCMSMTAPGSFRIALIQTCCYFARRDPFTHPHNILIIALPFMRSLIKVEVDEPMTEQALSSISQSPMICSILELFDAYPQSIVDELSDVNSQGGFIKMILFYVLSPNDTIRELATGVAIKVFESYPDAFRRFSMYCLKADTREIKIELWRWSSQILQDLCNRRTTATEFLRYQALRSYLSSRLVILKNIPALCEIPEDIDEVAIISQKLETMVLVSLCSPDVETCQMVISCIGVFLEECSWIEQNAESTKAVDSILRNVVTFQELSSPTFRFTGLVAFQKRVWHLLRGLPFPTPSILKAWEIAFEKWISLSSDVSNSTSDTIDDKKLVEWRNISGFLASLAGICIADRPTLLDEPPVGLLHWIDRTLPDGHEETPLARYLKSGLQLLASSNVNVRETMREILSVEISPLLYQPLLKALEFELEMLLTDTLSHKEDILDSNIVFAEQAASLLRILIERLESPSDLGAASVVHLGVLTLNFAKFIERVADGPSSLRVKIKICQLCETVVKRKEHLNLRDDMRIRNQLLEYIFGWMGRQSQPQAEPNGPGIRHEDLYRIQRDLDKACLRSLAELTFRLPLQPSESQTDAGMSELKSQMFHTYFNRFLSLLNHEALESTRSEPSSIMPYRDEQTSNSDLAIAVLSNLLSANIDVGLKHSLNIGYHDNVDIRAAFVRVLYNILTQGTEFSSLTDSAVSEKYEQLLNLLTEDLSLSVSMSSICPSNEVDELTISLLTVFEQRGLIFGLLEALIRQEIDQTENEAELLRRSCVATKMLSVYAKWKGVTYLRATIQNILERLVITSQELDLELDPARVSTQEELQQNMLQLQIVAKVFMDNICASASNMPTSFRRICNIIYEAVLPRFPNAKYTAVGAFIFLRFFCPAIVAPDAEGLVSTPPSKAMRRGLLLIAKIIQNLANNVLFGTKEPYMFPLNSFLVQHIHVVTTFLRDIAVPPGQVEPQLSIGLFDFGSCVALHRYLYDHWDHLRQTIISRKPKEILRTPNDLSRELSPVVEPLRNLITSLGPPPLAISWNRPQISLNSPPMYSRFQNFMLRNAFRNSESFLTSRAVYDGGESKDGISIVCIILRHIESESIAHDTLLYCYLKIASRLWHEPFGIFIDATCYNGRNEPSDEFLKMLDLMAPSELSNNLTRIYVYNMNSAFKRCLRRLLRLSARNETSVFNPNNVEYHLIGSLQELQKHFHLSHLHLPKETISVISDTRYMFQSITRLSKSKGKVEVVIKIGSQFVQVTTTKKQEVLSGFRLSSIINDIFRLGDIDEAPALVQSEEEPTFALRADGGKIVMCFTSPKKSDILQSMRGAKGKSVKDSRAKPMDRLVRPQDVPGTLLNLSLTNLSSHDQKLRLSSYNLLGALCRTFGFSAATRLLCTRDLSIPVDSARFIVSISKELANTEPQLTSDFLTEFFVGWESFPKEQKPLSLAYMSPWLAGLRTNVLTTEVDSEKGREKVAILFRKLIDLTVLDQNLKHVLEHLVWPSIAQDEILVDIFLSELMKAAMSRAAQQESLDMISSVIVGIGTVTVRGKILGRLRKTLNRSSLRPTRHLPDNAVWAEICVLLRFCLSLSFDNGMQSQMFFPEICHIVTMLANTGSQMVRSLVYRLLVNSIHAICVSFTLDDGKNTKLRGDLDLICDPRGEFFVGSSTLTYDSATTSTPQDSLFILSAVEKLTALLVDISLIATPSLDMSNAWRSRWMSLVASTAFQNNPAIQPRAFTVMGYLASQDVDDDLLYQVLVALRNSIGQFVEDGNGEMLVSIVTALSKMIIHLPPTSRYSLQLFWLALSLVRLVPISLFNCTAQFLDAVLTNMGTSSNLTGMQMIPKLMQCRTQLEDAILPIDDACGIHFNREHFHTAVCACLVGGITGNATRPTAIRVLSSFLDMETRVPESLLSEGCQQVISDSPYLSLIIARGVGFDEFNDTLWQTLLHQGEINEPLADRGFRSIETMDKVDLLLISVMELVDFQSLQDAAQARTLEWLSHLAVTRADVFIHLCGAMPSVLEDVLVHGQDVRVLTAAHALLRLITSSEKFSNAMGSVEKLLEILNYTGFSGLWQPPSAEYQTSAKQDNINFISKLIELIII